MEPTLWSDQSSLPDTTKQMDNQTCKARTWVIMQRLLHGLGTQVLGHVQVASPQAPFFPKVPICSLPPPPSFKDKVKVFVHIKRSVPWWTGIWLSWRQRGRPQPRVLQGLWHMGPTRMTKKIMWLEWFEFLVWFGKFWYFGNFGNFGQFGHFKVN